MLIDVNKWIDKNGSFDEAGGLDLVRHGYEWIRRMRKFENKADRHTFQKVFGNKRGNELWDCFLEVGRSIFILEDSYFLINDRNVFSLCLAECSDYDLYELVHNIETASDQDYNLCFLPGDKIEDLTMDETDGFVDTTGIVTSIKSKDVVEFYVENPFVKIKDE